MMNLDVERLAQVMDAELKRQNVDGVYGVLLARPDAQGKSVIEYFGRLPSQITLVALEEMAESEAQGPTQ